MRASAAIPSVFAPVRQGNRVLVDGKPARQDSHPLDRPVLLTRGVDQTKNCVGTLEVAGILRRALLDETLTDAL